MPTIRGRRDSINVRKVMWTLGELDPPHARIDAGMRFGRDKDADYLAKNPNGLVPPLEDGDLAPWESNAIVRYLAAAHGAGTPWPSEAWYGRLRERPADREHVMIPLS
jgi:glutathione S-transferase